MKKRRKTKPRPRHKVRRPGVPCPHCDSPFSEVSRTGARGPVLQRVRRCLDCGNTFPTFETTERLATGVIKLGREAQQIATDIATFASTLQSSPLSKFKSRQ